MAVEQSFSTKSSAELTGASVRQIDHWARTGLIRPSDRQASGKGSKRRYTFVDLVALQTVVALRGSGCPLQKIRVAVKHLKNHYPAASTGKMLAGLTLLTDGKQVYLLSNKKEIVEVVTSQMVWAVPLGKLIAQTQEKVDALPMEWEEKVKVSGEEYRLIVTRDDEDGGFVVQCKELPGALEQGESAKEAVANGKEAIRSVLKFMKKRQKQGAGGSSGRRRVKAG